MDPASEAFARSRAGSTGSHVEVDETLDRWLPDRRVTEVRLERRHDRRSPSLPPTRSATPTTSRSAADDVRAKLVSTARRGRRRAGGADGAEPVVESRRGRVVATGLTQPQLSQTPVAGMAMLQVAQTVALEPAAWSHRRARSRCAHARDLRRQGRACRRPSGRSAPKAR